MTEQKRFRIGNQTAWFARSITEPFEYAVSNGFDAFEWFPDKKVGGEGWQEEDLPEETRLYIKDMAAANDIRLSVHVPWRWSPFHQDSQGEMARALRLTEDIGAVVMNIHYYKKRGAAAFAGAIGPLIDKLTTKGIRLSIENTTETTPEDFNELFRLLPIRQDRGPFVGMCLDLGHANLCHTTRNDYIRYIDLLDGDVPIIHVHLHENYGDSDRHLPLFTGPSGKNDTGIQAFIERLKRRGFSGSLILEQWPDPPRLINEARERLLAIIGVAHGTATKPKMKIPTGDFVQLIAAADRTNRSWREKLRWVHDLFSEDAPHLTMEQLAYLAIYLRFLGTGQIKVIEDGSHYRPSHHARMAQDIFGRLTSMETPENSFVLRKIFPWLPSFDSDFLRPEPLTRIRDIAHRDDIPQDLKREIKTTLQNKLHRNAGPEDLETASQLLKRITSPDADYPLSFVEEFKKFHGELKEFFNAQSLDERLASIAATYDERDSATIHRFLAARTSAETSQQLIWVLVLLTELRKGFTHRRGGKADAEAQQILAADIALEDYSFVLLSRVIDALRSQKEVPWQDALRCLGLTVENMNFSGFEEQECLAIAAEIEAWRKDFDEGSRDQLLRLKASVDRCLRLAETYTHKILALFPEKAERLGHALGVDDRVIKVFTEAEIRGHPVFQFSKLAAFLLRNIRRKASLPPWDIIVPGLATGRLTTVQGLSGLISLPRGPIVALLEKVEGDEEIPSEVRGMVVSHETPHLSHLAVRARQAGVVFAVCEDNKILDSLRKLTGKTVILDTRDNDVNWRGSKGRKTEGPKRSASHVILPLVDASGLNGLVDAGRVTLQTGGGKAFGAKRLREMSEVDKAGFSTPFGWVIPFCIMEESLKLNPEAEKKYRLLVAALERSAPEKTKNILTRIRKVIEDIRLPEELATAMKRTFPPGKRLMVRSSSNCEDLEGFSGAGLYATVPNVSPERVEGAVRTVWASLWTERAVLSREQAGIPHKEARMAVLIQEMIVPDYSFILHTANPVTGKRNEVYIELAAGLGEALASAKLQGTPYRMVCDRLTGSFVVLSFASFSRAFLPGPPGELTTAVVDYSGRMLSTDERFRATVCEKLMDAAVSVEKHFGRPQDIEGVLSNEDIWLVQSRPQQGIN